MNNQGPKWQLLSNYWGITGKQTRGLLYLLLSIEWWTTRALLGPQLGPWLFIIHSNDFISKYITAQMPDPNTHPDSVTNRVVPESVYQ